MLAKYSPAGSKQEAHWPHRSPEKLVQINEQSNDYIYNQIGPVVLEKKIFKFCECAFAILLISHYAKRCRLSI